MFDQFRVIVYAFTGKLRDAATIRKYFWVFLSGVIMAIVILAYNSFLSLSSYKNWLERFTPWESNVLPLITTIAIATTVYMLMSGIASTTLDYFAGRTHKTKGHEPMFVAVVAALVLFLCLDIYANLKGVHYVSQVTTEAVKEDKTGDVYTSIQTEIDRVQSQREGLTTGQLGTRFGWWPSGTLGIGRFELNRRGNIKLDDLDQQLATLREQQTELYRHEKDKFEAEKNRYATTVATKKESHIRLVWFAYPLAFLICFIVQHYVDRALAHVEGEGQEQSTGLTNARIIGFSSTKGRPATPATGDGDPPMQKSERDQGDVIGDPLSYLAKYPGVVRDTLNGVSIPHTAANNGVGETTVKNVRRIMKERNMVS